MYFLSQGGEEEEEVPPPAAGPKPTPASDTPAAEGELQEGGGKDEEGEKGMRKEVKCEDKGNLAGERQSGDGQVRWVIEKKMELRNHIQI